MASKSINSFINTNLSHCDESQCTKNEFEIVSEILSKVEIRKQMTVCFEELKAHGDNKTTLKSISESNKYREEGNRLFRADKNSNALAASRCYTKAMLVAPKDSTALALAHANRAAALAEFGYYLDAYSDCELALKLGYPKDKQVKVLTRQAYCSIKLKNYFKLEGVMEKLRDLQLNEQYAKQREEFENQLKIIAELPGSWKQDDPHDYKVQNILVHPEKGRYMTAWKDYQKDDVLLCEKAFAFVPLREGKICSYCASEQFIPYPCYFCSKVVYCSHKCKLAHEKIHKYECFAYLCDLYESLGIAHLAIDTLIRGLPKIISQLTECTSAEKIWEQIETIGKSGKKGYSEILSLFNTLHLQSSKNVNVFALGSIIGANFLVCGTTFSEIYAKSPCSSLDWIIVISALILRHVAQMAVNGQSSVSVVFVDNCNENVALANIWNEPQHLKKGLLHGFRGIEASFAGIYPFLSMCNHSCEPSFRLNFDGNRIVAKASRDMKKGQQIFNSYVLDCRNRSRSKRKEELRTNYYFECDCEHCDPKSNDEEFRKFHKYLCTNLNCNTLFSPPTDDMRWWLQLKESSEISIKCPSCETAVETWCSKFDKIFADDILNRTELIEALQTFNYTDEIVNVSELRNYMAHKIVISFFELWKDEVIEEKLFDEVAHVLKEWLDLTERQNDVESVLYATISTFALDLMAEGKYFDFDTNKIRRSFDMLSTELRPIFENYITDYIGENFDNSSRDFFFVP